MGGRRRVLAALAVTGLVFAACFLVVLGLLVLGERGQVSLAGNRVALVEVTGLIIDAQPVIRQIEEDLEDPSIRAIVIRVDSPGGVVGPSQEIHDAVVRAREQGKPVVVSMGAIAASGGYYLAAPADHIVANPGTLTGSIGVLLQLTEIEGLLKKVGVHFEVIKAGRHKDVGNFARAMTDEERAILQGLLDDMYEQFVAAVADGRHLDRDRVRELADGRVYSGRRAKELGLVDSLGGLDEAVRTAGRLAGIPGKPELVRPRRPFHLTQLADWLDGRSPLGAWLPARAALATWPLFSAPKLPLYLME